MPLTANICLENHFNCQLLCLLKSILMLPKHVYGISQMGEEKTILCKTEARPRASNWALMCTCCPFATRDPPALPFWLKWTSVGEGRVLTKSFCVLFYVNFHKSTLPSLWAVPGIMLKVIKWGEGAREQIQKEEVAFGPFSIARRCQKTTLSIFFLSLSPFLLASDQEKKKEKKFLWKKHITHFITFPCSPESIG